MELEKLFNAYILKPYEASEVELDYYDNPDTEVGLVALFMDTEVPELESVESSGACQYCGYQMSIDD